MTRTAVIVGVGPGLGESLARTFAAEGCQVALFARSRDFLEDLAADLPDPGTGLAVQTDLTDVEQIRTSFESVREQFPDRAEETFLDPAELAETYWHLVERDDVGTQLFEVHVTNGPRSSEFV